jgi:hypothetical protein
MAANQVKQERTAAIFMSFASVFIAAMEWIGRPEPGEIVEAEPDWYVTFNLVVHGAIVLALLFMLIRLPHLVAGRPGQRLPFLAMILAGILAAAYVVGRDMGLV